MNISDSISQTITQLRQLVQLNIQDTWQQSKITSEFTDLADKLSVDYSQTKAWQIVPLNEKNYITWAAGNQVQWLAQKIIIPHNLHGYPLAELSLRLILTWWAKDAKIFVNGKLVQEGDLFDSSARILLTSSATPEEEIFVTLRLVSPGHDIGGLMRSLLVYERNQNTIPPTPLSKGGKKGLNFKIKNLIDPGFVADELSILSKYLEAFEPEKLELFTANIQQIKWDVVSDAKAFDQSLLKVRKTLEPLATNLKKCFLNLLGHAHLDMAWLWTVDETWEVGERTFLSVINLQKDYPELIFCHTSPVLYEWIEKHRPELFKGIQEAVKAKCWEVLGGMWVEPEVNLISGESLARQLLYGQRYIQEKFGNITKVAWLPDSFGFSWQLPQIFNQSGIEYFVTGKLHWNDTTKFPHGIFWWQSPDGTQLLTLISPPNVAGVMDTNPITMTDYAVEWEQQTGLKEAFWLPGVGDHGGGPTRDMLEVQKRWQNSPFFPQIKFTKAVDYSSKIKELGDYSPIASNLPIPPTPIPPFPLGKGGRKGGNKGDKKGKEISKQQLKIPIWDDELYLEFHRGCYTTHADQKSFNRRCEDLLYQAEIWASLATIIQGSSYPKLKLESAWKQVLFNQFHDILPGTSIPEVFVEANQAWQEVQKVGQEILAESLQSIADQISLSNLPQVDAKPIIIFNSLNWNRSEVVTISVDSRDDQVYDLVGNLLPSQLSENNQLIFLAEDIPSVGYRLFWLSKNSKSNLSNIRSPQPPLLRGAKGRKRGAKKDTENLKADQDFILENEILRVVVNSKTGDLESIFDKINQQESLKGAGNQLQAFQDKGQYWDAWNIDPNYANYPLEPSQLKLIEVLEWGPIQWRIQVIRELGNSEFCQDYILQTNSPILKIVTQVNWKENHVLVKAAFPLTLESDYVTYEIPCASIQRSTRPQTPHEKAKWEVPALRWADLTDNLQNYGVSLLNDCKYGYDSQPNCLRLTLLRSPKFPDPNADIGIHQFTYAIYPHSGNWRTAKTVQKGYELNLPLQVFVSDKIDNNLAKKLPPVSQFLKLSAENLILMAFKQSEDEPKRWILRCYESQGEEAEILLQSDLELVCDGEGLLQTDRPVNLLEQPIEKFSVIRPYQIASFELVQGFFSEQ